MTNPWGSPQPFDPNQPGFPGGGPEEAGPAGYGYPPPPSYPAAGVPYPPSYPGGYPGYPPAGYPMPAPPEQPQAVPALVLGIVGLVLCCGLPSPFAIWLGRKSMKEIDASGGWLGGRGQAQAGFILGIVGTVLLALGVLYFVLMVVVVGSSGVTRAPMT